MPHVETHAAGEWTRAVIIPAFNEGEKIAVTLAQLFDDGFMLSTRVIVACNGCTDDTVVRARAALPVEATSVTVLDLPRPGKTGAIRAAEEMLPPGPRLVLDADAGCAGRTALALLDAVDSADGERVVADVAVPTRVMDLSSVRQPLARAYYRVWQDLAWIRAMPSGRAAYALSWEIRRPQGAFPELIADDRWATSLVPRSEVVVVAQAIEVRPVPTLRQLLAVRTRIYRGNLQAPPGAGAGAVGPGSRRPALLRMARDPRRWVGLAVFLVVDKVAMRRARRSRTDSSWSRS